MKSIKIVLLFLIIILMISSCMRHKNVDVVITFKDDSTKSYTDVEITTELFSTTIMKKDGTYEKYKNDDINIEITKYN